MGNITCCLNDDSKDSSEECDNVFISSESGFQLLNQSNRFSQEHTMRDDLTSKQSSSNHGSQSSYPYSSSEHLYINDHDSRTYEEEEMTNSYDTSWNSPPLHFEDGIHASHKTITYTTSPPTVINPHSWQRLTLAPRYGDGVPVFVAVVKEGISIPETITMLSNPSRRTPTTQTLAPPRYADGVPVFKENTRHRRKEERIHQRGVSPQSVSRSLALVPTSPLSFSSISSMEGPSMKEMHGNDWLSDDDHDNDSIVNSMSRDEIPLPAGDIIPSPGDELPPPTYTQTSVQPSIQPSPSVWEVTANCLQALHSKFSHKSGVEDKEGEEDEGEFPFAITPIKPSESIHPIVLLEVKEVGVDDTFPFVITPIHVHHRLDHPWHEGQGLARPSHQGQGLDSPYQQEQGLEVEDIELVRMEERDEEDWLQVGLGVDIEQDGIHMVDREEEDEAGVGATPTTPSTLNNQKPHSQTRQHQSNRNSNNNNSNNSNKQKKSENNNRRNGTTIITTATKCLPRFTTSLHKKKAPQPLQHSPIYPMEDDFPPRLSRPISPNFTRPVFVSSTPSRRVSATPFHPIRAIGAASATRATRGMTSTPVMVFTPTGATTPRKVSLSPFFSPSSISPVTCGSARFSPLSQQQQQPLSPQPLSPQSSQQSPQPSLLQQQHQPPNPTPSRPPPTTTSAPTSTTATITAATDTTTSLTVSTFASTRPSLKTLLIIDPTSSSDDSSNSSSSSSDANNNSNTNNSNTSSDDNSNSSSSSSDSRGGTSYSTPQSMVTWRESLNK